jgi:hypothetical protein
MGRNNAVLAKAVVEAMTRVLPVRNHADQKHAERHPEI